MLSKLKLCAAFAAAVAAIAATNAQATGSHTSPPTPSPTPAQPTTSTSSAESAAAAAAKAQAGAVAGANAQGGNASQRQSSRSGASITDNGSSSTESNLYVLPAPVFTPPMAAVQCPVGVEITNEAFSILVASAARGHTDNSDCVLIALRNGYVAQCQFFSAKQLMDLHTAKKMPGFKATTNNYYDLTPAECRALNAPAPVVSAPTEVRYITILPTPEVKLPPVPDKTAKKRVRTVLPCEKEQVPGKVWQCKAKR